MGQVYDEAVVSYQCCSYGEQHRVDKTVQSITLLASAAL
jgi:hypothetical protein